MVKSKGIPENWVDVAKIGTFVGTSRFVPLRVPLDDKYFFKFEGKKGEIWTPSDFLRTQRKQKYNVKMVIDLTNTYKYYDGHEEFKNSGVEYVKLRIEGFSEPPSRHDVAKFMQIVDEFLAREPEGAIAVHCTHGLNRTGYLVVSYMIKRLQYSLTEALNAFTKARPPGLIKHMYIADLYEKFGTDEPVRFPQLPAWASAKYSKGAAELKRTQDRKRRRFV